MMRLLDSFQTVSKTAGVHTNRDVARVWAVRIVVFYHHETEMQPFNVLTVNVPSLHIFVISLH
jgi:hypothetical protein